MKKIIFCFLVSLTLVSVPSFAKDSAKVEVQNIKMTVTENGFEPSQIKVKPDVPVVLHITRKTNGTCAREIEVPSMKVKVELPLNKEVEVKLGKLSKGEIKFGCSMEMMVGGVMFIQ